LNLIQLARTNFQGFDLAPLAARPPLPLRSLN
ncbi:hypothetical protein E3A20_17900, partial [Planctomyces bekefii]